MDRFWIKIGLVFSILTVCSLSAFAAEPESDPKPATESKIDLDPASRLEGAKKEAWLLFISAVTTLQDKGDRAEAARLFHQVVDKYSDSGYDKQSKELAELLDQMVKEDAKWKEPKDISQLSQQEKIDYYVYHLRDVNCYQWSQPGWCYLLDKHSSRPDSPLNTAIKLKEIGEPAIPALIELLEDRRPLRSVGYWRNFVPYRSVLRYQDAASQILNELLPTQFYRGLGIGSNFSEESPQIRRKAIAAIKSWYEKSKGKSPLEKKWLAVEEVTSIYPLLALLEELAFDHDQREQVLAKLRRMSKERDPFQLPQVSYLMCRLGDTSHVGEVASAYISGKYNYAKQFPGDSAAGINAQEYVLRQLILFGTPEQLEPLKKHLRLKTDPLDKKHSIIRVFSELVSKDWGGLPRGYDKDRFPVYFLIDILESTEPYARSYSGEKPDIYVIRDCDKAAEIIQEFTGKDFGFNEKESEADKDKAIAKIQDWWRKTQEDKPPASSK